jgi:hypothetical protein
MAHTFPGDKIDQRNYEYLATKVYPDVFSQKCIGSSMANNSNDIYHCNQLKTHFLHAIHGETLQVLGVDYHLTHLWGNDNIVDRHRSIKDAQKILGECYKNAKFRNKNSSTPQLIDECHKYAQAAR